MRGTRPGTTGTIRRATLCCLAAVLCLALAACGRQPEPPAPPAGGQAPYYGAVFLDRGECSTRGRTAFREVACTGERAAARVLARHAGRQARGPLCPVRTDFVLHISEHRPDADEDGDGSVPRGYACMRALFPPHPGDPGRGGGPRTVPGDCVYLSTRREARETACAAGSGARHRPEYEVTAAVPDRPACPPDTTLYLRLPDRTTGCARPHRAG